MRPYGPIRWTTHVPPMPLSCSPPCPPLPSPRRDAKVPDPDPELERKTFNVADGFEVNLFAADPLLAKPIQMNFDPQGRLWVASQRDLPADQAGPDGQRQDPRPRRHRRRRQGRQDHRLRRRPAHPHRRRARRRRRLRRQQHRAAAPAATPTATARPTRRASSSPASAPRTRTTSSTRSAGARTAACTSTSRSTSTATSRRRTACKRLNGGGIWQFRPETMELDVFVRGFVNPWGHHFDRWGQSFVTDGAGGEGINYVVPGAVLRHRRRRARGS